MKNIEQIEEKIKLLKKDLDKLNQEFSFMNQIDMQGRDGFINRNFKSYT